MFVDQNAQLNLVKDQKGRFYTLPKNWICFLEAENFRRLFQSGDAWNSHDNGDSQLAHLQIYKIEIEDLRSDMNDQQGLCRLFVQTAQDLQSGIHLWTNRVQLAERRQQKSPVLFHIEEEWNGE